jgi:hypothetical protein
VGVSKVGGIFVDKLRRGRFGEKSTTTIREYAMKESRGADQEAQAQELAAAIALVTQEELLQIARTLVAAEPADLFGPTEFKVRQLAHPIAAKAYQRRRAQKKSATSPRP